MTTEEKDLQSLLSQVEAIRNKYDQITEITGEKFNIFSILGLQDNEVRLHSNLLNELLNPKGRHGQKDKFLILFIDLINSKIKDEIIIEKSKNISSQKIISFNTEQAISRVEINAGKINKDTSEGGRVDIIVNDNNRHGIIIENKVWAGDQEEQLLRYHNYGEIVYSSFHLIYLTIDGREPTEFSTKRSLSTEQYLCLSYEEDIILWLEQCRKECSQLPIIRETITQYINQLNNYSGKSINHMENKEIQELILRKGNFENAVNISKNVDAARKEIEKRFFESLKNRIDDKFEWKNLINTISENKKNTEYYFQLFLKDEIYFRIMIQGNHIRFGIKAFGDIRDDSPKYHYILDTLNSLQNTSVNFKNEEYWVAYSILPDTLRSNKDELLADLCDNKKSDTISNELKKLIEFYIPITKKL